MLDDLNKPKNDYQTKFVQKEISVLQDAIVELETSKKSDRLLFISLLSFTAALLTFVLFVSQPQTPELNAKSESRKHNKIQDDINLPISLKFALKKPMKIATKLPTEVKAKFIAISKKIKPVQKAKTVQKTVQKTFLAKKTKPLSHGKTTVKKTEHFNSKTTKPLTYSKRTRRIAKSNTKSQAIFPQSVRLSKTITGQTVTITNVLYSKRKLQNCTTPCIVKFKYKKNRYFSALINTLNQKELLQVARGKVNITGKIIQSNDKRLFSVQSISLNSLFKTNVLSQTILKD
jgi:hypothetical protein